MRKIALGFLTLLMLTPVLACAMAVCPMKSAQAAETNPCHETNDNGVMFALDCMGVDLFQQNIDQDIKHDQSFKSVDYVGADLIIGDSYLSTDNYKIRGPPYEDIRTNGQLSTIHITQRFRI